MSETGTWLRGRPTDKQPRNVTFKGSVRTAAHLPESAEIGDAYTVSSDPEALYIFDQTYASESDRPQWLYEPHPQVQARAAPFAAPTSVLTEPLFCTPDEVVKLIGREGEPALLSQAAEVIATVSAQVDELYGPWGSASGHIVTVRGTTRADLFPGVTFSSVESVSDSQRVLDPSEYSHFGAALFRNSGWGGPYVLWTIEGTVDRSPSAAVKTVVKAIAARVLLNPTANQSQSVEGTSVSPTVGMTLHEQRVLQRYRLTSCWPRGNP